MSRSSEPWRRWRELPHGQRGRLDSLAVPLLHYEGPGRVDWPRFHAFQKAFHDHAEKGGWLDRLYVRGSSGRAKGRDQAARRLSRR